MGLLCESATVLLSDNGEFCFDENEDEEAYLIWISSYDLNAKNPLQVLIMEPKRYINFILSVLFFSNV